LQNDCIGSLCKLTRVVQGCEEMLGKTGVRRTVYRCCPFLVQQNVGYEAFLVHLT